MTPRREGPLPTVRLPDHLEGALGARHPWVYRDHLPDGGRKLPDGGWVRLEAGRAAAVGIAEREGAVAVRLYRHAAAGGAVAVPDRAWLRRAADAAVELRAPLAATGDDAMRLVFGEADALPGITIDRYGRYGVVRSYAPSLRPGTGTAAAGVLLEVVEAVARAAGLRGVVWGGGPVAARAERDEGAAVADAGDDAEAPRVLWGEAPPPRLTVRDGGQAMVVEFGVGQKTGLFLDQRENRAVVRAHAGGRRVLDLFAYTGAFSVAALAGGAEAVTSVDVSAGALQAAERNVALLGDDAAARHRTVRGDLMRDAERVLAEAVGDGAPGLVVLDPPSLARSKGQRHGALRAFRRLNAAALAALGDGGLLATASCTAQVGMDDFRAAVAAAAQDAGVRAQVLHEAGHALDHPVALSFPEGRYLSFLLVRVTRPE